jgi:hypothetical protein
MQTAEGIERRLFAAAAARIALSGPCDPDGVE